MRIFYIQSDCHVITWFVCAFGRYVILTCLLVLSHNLYDWTSYSSFLLSTRSQLELGENFWPCSEIVLWTPCPMGILSHWLGWLPMPLQWCWGIPGSNQRDVRGVMNWKPLLHLPLSKYIPDKIVFFILTTILKVIVLE
jgi:hypothetical protein